MRTVAILNREEINEVINLCDHCFVGVNEPDGTPYVFPMNFAYVDDTIILHSGPEGTHLDLLENDNRACITFSTDNNKLMYQHIEVACSFTVIARSVICKGKIEFIEDFDEKYRLLNLFMEKFTGRQFKISEPAIKNVKIWLMKPDSVSARAFGQNFRYKENVFER